MGKVEIPRGYALVIDEDGNLKQVEHSTSWGSSNEPEEPTPIPFVR